VLLCPQSANQPTAACGRDSLLFHQNMHCRWTSGQTYLLGSISITLRRKVHHERRKYWYLLPTDPPQLTTRRRIRSLCKQRSIGPDAAGSQSTSKQLLHLNGRILAYEPRSFSPSRSRSMYLLNSPHQERRHESSAWWAARRNVVRCHTSCERCRELRAARFRNRSLVPLYICKNEGYH